MDTTLGQPVELPADDAVAEGFAVARAVLKPRRARPFFGRHPWVLDSAVDRVEGSPADGDVVDLVTDAGKFVARGLFNGQSRIRVRLYSWNSDEPLNDALWRGRLQAAVELRKKLHYDAPTGAARLAFSEGDHLSGLIVDRYGEWLCVQANSLAVERRLGRIAPILAELTGCRGIVARTEKGISRIEGVTLRDGPLWGQPPDGPVFIEEHGLRYGVDLAEGQKTGFYLDQRENRLAAARYVRGGRVLDMFCYSGGFSLCAERHGGASETWGFDSSQKAVALAQANAELNGACGTHFDVADGFEALASLVARRQRFELVVLDPPKFARSRQSLDDALRAYFRLNRLAVDLVSPGGVLVTCSCSGHVMREDFLHMLSGVSQQSRRGVQVLEQRGAAPDHPVAATCLEGEYLKCFICRIGD